jgi:hypothetical protein
MGSPLRIIVVRFGLSAARASHFAACNRYCLPSDRAGSLAAQPKHGIGDLGWSHKAALWIMP